MGDIYPRETWVVLGGIVYIVELGETFYIFNIQVM